MNLQKASGTGLEYDDLRRELELWNRRYIDVDSLMSKQSSFTRNVSENSVTVSVFISPTIHSLHIHDV